MSTYAWPTNDSAFALTSVVWAVRTLSLESESPLNGDVQTNTRPGSRWAPTLAVPRQSWEERRRLLAFLARLNGRQHRISMADPTLRQPAGTIALSGVTVNASAPQFAQTVQLANCGNGATLLRGDWFKLGSQAVRCVVDATADGSGVMTVEFRHMLRAAVPAGAAVTTNNVTALYILAASDVDAGFDASGAAPEMQIPLVEVFS